MNATTEEWDAAHRIEGDKLYVEILPYEIENGEFITTIAICPMPDGGVTSIINSSVHKAAKWLKDTATGKTYYWIAEGANHDKVAFIAKVADYTKGIATLD